MIGKDLAEFHGKGEFSMSQDWSRRQLLKGAGAGALGVTGLCLAGCSTSKPGTRLVGESTVTGEARHFVSRPDLAPPLISVSGGSTPASPGYILLATAATGPGQGGTMIIRKNGELVWFDNDRGNTRLDLQLQNYRGQQVLTWWQGSVQKAGYGEGVGIIADSSYRTIHTVHAAKGLQADLHELNITPQGTALITIYRPTPADLSGVGGSKHGQVLAGVAQEIDIATGKLLFEWDSLDHVPVEDTYQKYTGGSDPFDYFHINSIALASDGDLLISARDTWTVYKVSRPTGEIVWRMNGKKSDFTFGPGASFFWQHHVRMLDSDTMTVFDNGAKPAEEKHSRALVLNVDLDKKHVTLRNQYWHPGKVILSATEGSAQLLPDGRMFVGWGNTPAFSEFSPDGRLLLDGSMPKDDPSYRAFLIDWNGHPLKAPDVAARHRSGGATVYASWNGATNVASWTVYAGKSRSSLARVGSARSSGFETAIAVPDPGPYFAVQPRDAAGAVLARSATVPISGAKKVKRTYGCGSSNCGY